MKILICTFSFPYLDGNVFDSRFVYGEAVGYANNGSEVTVLTPHFPGSPELEKISEKIRVIRFPYFLPKSAQKARAPGKPLYNPGSLFALLQLPILCLVFIIRIIQQAKHTDIIHAQWTLTALLALPAKWITGKPLVVTARGSDIRLLPAWLNRFIFRQVDAAIDCFGPTIWNTRNKSNFPSNYISLPHLVLDDSIADTPEEIAAVINNKPGTFIIVYIGRFHPIKVSESKLPLFDLIPAVSHFKKTNNNFHVFYIGDGERDVMKRLQELLGENNLRDDVSILGPKTNIMSYIKHCDLGIGGIAFNGVSQEFTICKKPQILMATEENIQSPWKENVSALFCTPNDVMELAAKLEWAIDHTLELQNIGQLASQEMKQYFMESNAGGKYYFEAFSSLMKSRKNIQDDKSA